MFVSGDSTKFTSNKAATSGGVIYLDTKASATFSGATVIELNLAQQGAGSIAYAKGERSEPLDAPQKHNRWFA